MQNAKKQHSSESNGPMGKLHPYVTNDNTRTEGIRPSAGDRSLVKEEQTRDQTSWKRPTLSIHKGVLTYFESNYCFGPEGAKALREYFKLLSIHEKDTHPKFKLSSYVKHEHPVGATLRAYFHDLILYKYESESSMKDIGASLIRTHNRYDVGGKPVTDRIHSMAPIVSGRDMLRERNHRTALERMKGYCCHAGGDRVRNRLHCECEKYYPITTSVDSIYYDGVLEEMACDSVQTEGVGYVVFNDYDMASRIKGQSGTAFDEESHYIIEGTQVTSTVRGNVAPYSHKILRTSNTRSWQYKISLHSLRKTVMLVFEELECFYNGDIPYRLCRVYALDCNILDQFGEREGLKNIPRMDSVFVEEPEVVETSSNYSEPSPIVAQSPSTNDASTQSDISHLEIGQPKQYTLGDVVDGFFNYDLRELFAKPLDVQPVVLPDFKKYVMDTTVSQEDQILRISEFCHKVPQKKTELEVDYVQRVELYKKKMFSWYEILRQFSGKNEKIYNSIDNFEVYVNLEITKTRWYTLGWKIRSYGYKAKLEHVVAAYEKLGTKQTVASIEFSCVAMQRELATKLSVGIIDLHEAFIIARVIRAQQHRRMCIALENSSSAQA